jgi:hypothetical protein
MFADLEDAWNSSTLAERASYLWPAWQASDREARIRVMRYDATGWLDLAWQLRIRRLGSGS